MIGRFVEVAGLGKSERAAMFALLRRSFDGTRRDVFDADLASKDYAILVVDERGDIRGFTSFAVVKTRVLGEPVHALYSGDTIVDREAWGSFALAQTWIDAVRIIRGGLGGERLVWLLICSGPRTYRFLPVFFREFYPRFDRETPFEVQSVIDRLAEHRYGSGYDPRRGVVLLDHPQPLRSEIRDAPGVALDEHVAFFFDKNPGHSSGDELVCFAELSDENLTAAGIRMKRAGERARCALGVAV